MGLILNYMHQLKLKINVDDKSQDDPKAEGGQHHDRQDHQGGGDGQVLGHTLREGVGRALYFGRFIVHSGINHQCAQHEHEYCLENNKMHYNY